MLTHVAKSGASTWPTRSTTSASENPAAKSIHPSRQARTHVMHQSFSVERVKPLETSDTFTDVVAVTDN